MCLQQFPKTRMSGSARMCSGTEFHTAGPACEKACSPNLVGIRSCGSEKSVDDVTSDVDPGGIKRLHTAGRINWTSVIGNWVHNAVGKRGEPILQNPDHPAGERRRWKVRIWSTLSLHEVNDDHTRTHTRSRARCLHARLVDERTRQTTADADRAGRPVAGDRHQRGIDHCMPQPSQTWQRRQHTLVPCADTSIGTNGNFADSKADVMFVAKVRSFAYAF